jgi:hypothetical protein
MTARDVLGIFRLLIPLALANQLRFEPYELPRRQDVSPTAENEPDLG